MSPKKIWSVAVGLVLLPGCAGVLGRINKQFEPARPKKSFMVCPLFQSGYDRRVVEDEMMRRLRNYQATAYACEISSNGVLAPEIATKVDAILVIYVEQEHSEQLYVPPKTFTTPGFTTTTQSGYISPDLGFGSVVSAKSESLTFPGETVRTGGNTISYVDLYYGAALYSSANRDRIWDIKLQNEFHGKTTRQIANECAATIAMEMNRANQM